MQFLQAKTIDNKLGVLDNRPYAIDKVIFTDSGFRLLLSDYDGREITVAYRTLEQLRREFDIISSITSIQEYREWGYGTWIE